MTSKCMLDDIENDGHHHLSPNVSWITIHCEPLMLARLFATGRLCARDSTMLEFSGLCITQLSSTSRQPDKLPTFALGTAASLETIHNEGKAREQIRP